MNEIDRVRQMFHATDLAADLRAEREERRAYAAVREVSVCVECGAEVEGECHYHQRAGAVTRAVR